MNQLLSAIAFTTAEVERMRRELAVVEQRLATLRRAAGLPVASVPAAEPSPAPAVAPATRISDACRWLRLALAGGPLRAEEIRQRAAVAGLAWRSVQRAGRLLGVEMRRHGFAATAHSTWTLPR